MPPLIAIDEKWTVINLCVIESSCTHFSHLAALLRAFVSKRCKSLTGACSNALTGQSWYENAIITAASITTKEALLL